MKVKIEGSALAAGLGRYTAVYEREGGQWIVEVAELPECHTYGDSLSRARSKIREALGLWVHNAATAEIVDDVRLPARARKAVKTAAEARRAAEQASKKAQASTQAMARQLRAAGLSTRDAAELSGLSQQRIAQLTAATS